MTNNNRFYWDSCAWLGLVNQEQSKMEALADIYEQARKGKFELWTSTISFVEVYQLDVERRFEEKPYKEENLEIIEQLFEQDFIKLIPVDMEIARCARRLRRQIKGLQKAADSVHLASALRWSLDELHTYDQNDLLHLDGKLKSKNGDYLKICVPSIQDLPLFEESPGDE